MNHKTKEQFGLQQNYTFSKAPSQKKVLKKTECAFAICGILTSIWNLFPFWDHWSLHTAACHRLGRL